MTATVDKSRRLPKGHVKKAPHARQEVVTKQQTETEDPTTIDGSTDIYAGRFLKGPAFRMQVASAKLANSGSIQQFTGVPDSDQGYTGFDLSEAARLGDLKQVQTLLNHGADPNGKTTSSEPAATPLQCAAYHADIAVMALLLERGASVSRSHGAIGTALHAAAMNGTVEACRLLLSYGAYIQKVAGRCGSPVHAAAFGRNTATMRFLLSQGAHFADYAPWESCRWTDLSPDYQEIIVEDILAEVSSLYRDVVEAAQWGATLFVRARLDKGADVNTKDELLGRTPLHWAAANGDLELVKLCLSRGASRQATDKLGLTPMMLAWSLNKRMDVVDAVRENNGPSEYEVAVAAKIRLTKAFDNLAF